MKRIFILIALAFSISAQAQEIKVKEDKEKINGATNPVLTVIIYETDEKTVEKEWKSLMKNYDAKVSTSDGVFADNALIKDLSENTADIYAIVKKDGDNVKLIVGVDLGGIFLSSDKSKEYKVMETIIKKFATEITTNAVKEQLSAAEKEQKKRENTYDDLVKENSNLHKDIEDFKSKITKAEQDIVDNEKQQSEAKSATEEQVKIVEAIKKKLSEIK